MSITISIQPYESLQENVIFVNGLNYEKVKYKYPWLLNAKIQDAIIGEDANGIVWYRGTWICGEWFDGTWYSGTFESGVWYNGSWYSYLLRDFDIYENIFNIIDINDTYSVFKTGVWVNGSFYNGTFGQNLSTNWEGFSYYDIKTVTGYPVFKNVDTNEYIIQTTWVNGVYYNGLMFDNIWVDGTCMNGTINNSQWMNGKHFNGTFNGDTWYDGTWFGGQFIKGKWLNGIFTQANNNIISRFGNTTNATGTTCEWFNGDWKRGEWFSGYVVDSYGKVIPSTQHNISIWYNGTWRNGTWFGGHFLHGQWYNGTWYDGIFGSYFVTNWSTPNYVYQTGTATDITWSGLTNWTNTGATTPMSIAFPNYEIIPNSAWAYHTNGGMYTFFTSANTYDQLEFWFPNFGYDATYENIYSIGDIITVYDINNYLSNNYEITSSYLYTDLYWGTIRKYGTEFLVYGSSAYTLCVTALYSGDVDSSIKTSKTLCFSGFNFSFNDKIDIDIADVDVKLTHKRVWETDQFKKEQRLFGKTNIDLKDFDPLNLLTTIYETQEWKQYCDINQIKTTTLYQSDLDIGTMYYSQTPIHTDLPYEWLKTGLTFNLKLELNEAWLLSYAHIYDVKVRVLYNSKNPKPSWHNGTWYNGTFDGLDWHAGRFKKGNWINGVMYNGIIGS